MGGGGGGGGWPFNITDACEWVTNSCVHVPGNYHVGNSL